MCNRIFYWIVGIPQGIAELGLSRQRLHLNTLAVLGPEFEDGVFARLHIDQNIAGLSPIIRINVAIAINEGAARINIGFGQTIREIGGIRERVSGSAHIDGWAECVREVRHIGPIRRHFLSEIVYDIGRLWERRHGWIIGERDIRRIQTRF